MEDAVWLGFLKTEAGETSPGSEFMYSVIPEQYSGGEYPNGCMGITADGRFVASRYKSNGTPDAVQGIKYGDIVADAEDNSYLNITISRKFRAAAQTIDSSAVEVVSDGAIWTDPSVEAISVDNLSDTVVDQSTPPADAKITETDKPLKNKPFAADQFADDTIPQKLWKSLPDEITVKITIGNNAIEKLNNMLVSSNVNTVTAAIIKDLSNAASMRSAGYVSVRSPVLLLSVPPVLLPFVLPVPQFPIPTLNILKSWLMRLRTLILLQQRKGTPLCVLSLTWRIPTFALCSPRKKWMICSRLLP